MELFDVPAVFAPTVLVVDDEPRSLDVISHILQPEFRVLAVTRGLRALDVLRQEPRPDLVLLDILMPDMDGYEVLRRIKEDTVNARVPVIFLTALGKTEDEEAGLAAGAVDFINKPINPAILKARIRTHLELKRARELLERENSWLEGEVQRRTYENALLQETSLASLVELAETRDTDTGFHILRTRSLVESLGTYCLEGGLYARELPDAPTLRNITRAAQLHDIGKIGIPDAILLKPGRLDPQEFEIMKTHCRIGSRALSKAVDYALLHTGGTLAKLSPDSLRFLELAIQVAQSHHERWDGTGYPEGLAGEAIPFPARLMAVADVFDALTHQRVYKAAWPFEKAFAFIEAQAGTQFDPLVVRAFSASSARLRDILERFSDAPPDSLRQEVLT